MSFSAEQPGAILRPAEGFSHVGERFMLGYGSDFYAIYDKNERRLTPSEPVAVFPRTQEGWVQAWTLFAAWEPNAHAVSPTRSRRSTATGSPSPEQTSFSSVISEQPPVFSRPVLLNRPAPPAPPVKPLKARKPRAAILSFFHRKPRVRTITISSPIAAEVSSFRTTDSGSALNAPLKAAPARIIAHPSIKKPAFPTHLQPALLVRFSRGLKNLFIANQRVRVLPLSVTLIVAVAAGTGLGILVLRDEPLSYQAYLRQAVPICSTLSEQLQAAASGWSPGNGQAMARVLSKDALYESEAFSRLEQLPRPASEDAQLSQFFAAASTAIVEQQNLAAALSTSNLAEASIAAASLARTTAAYNSLANELGLGSCRIGQLP